MNKTGRPKNTSGSLYQRRDSSVWWMSYRDQDGRFRQESTRQRNKTEAEKTLRKRLVARDEGLLPNEEQLEAITFNEWADWFLVNRSKPPFCSENTHHQNLGGLKFLRPRFDQHKLHEITSEEIEAYLMKRLNTGKRVHTKAGLHLRGKLKPATVHQEFRILRRILNVAVKKRRLAINPCSGVEFPVAVAATTRKPHYLTASEQQRLEACAPVYLHNVIVIMVEMGLRPYRERMPMRKGQVEMGQRDRASAGVEDGERNRGHADVGSGSGSVRLADEGKRRFRVLVPEPVRGREDAAHHHGTQAMGPDAETRRAAALFVVRVAAHVRHSAQRRRRRGSLRDADAAPGRVQRIQAL